MSNTARRTQRQPRHERLTAWQAADELTMALFHVTHPWPPGNEFLSEELRTSAIAAAHHLVLGTMEPDNAGFRRQVDVTIGKLARIGASWLCARDFELVKADVWGELEAKRDHAERLARGLYAALGRKATSAKSGVTAEREKGGRRRRTSLGS